MRLLILGTGSMARKHVEGFSEVEGVEIAGCVDLDPAVAKDFAAANGIPYWSADLGEAAPTLDRFLSASWPATALFASSDLQRFQLRASCSEDELSSAILRALLAPSLTAQ